MATRFLPADLEQLAERGIPEAEAQRQLELLARGPRALSLLRPCSPGDGLRRLSPAEQADYEARGAALLASGQGAKFVPASGAASRMFQDLLQALDQPGEEAPPAAREALARAGDWPFAEAWAQAWGGGGAAELARSALGEGWRGALATLLLHPGLEYARLPKAFIPFHRVAGRPRTALEQHWRECAALGIRRLHLSLSSEHENAFHHLRRELGTALGAEGLPAVDLDHSLQDPATDTLAGDGAGGPFRDEAGRLLFRPGGHGSLLRNLQRLARESPLVLLKNVDNIAHPRLWPECLRWKRILAGVLAEALQAGGAAPLRVAGVVPNTGEPGGGPFWVAGQAQPQIVESAQVDSSDPLQRAVFASATHFNPVDIVCWLGDGKGRPFELERFADPEAVFLARKTHLGRPLLALERPGLWNGAMAGWQTLFVEVPLETFHPVKRVQDLLKPAHRGEAA